MNQLIDFPCLAIQQPIGPFYIGVMDSKALIRISSSDIIHIDKDERDIETVSGLERPISRNRVKELREYVNNVDAAFPTGVILAVKSDFVKYNEDLKMMSIEDRPDAALIIDGQHRIEGLRGFRGEDGKVFQVNVTIFVDMDPEDQAIVFSTINLKQAPVSRSINYELFEYAKSRSPQKTCHQIARRLNQADGSPFKDKIMILGFADDKEKETLTQAAFIKPLERLVTPEKQAMSDRNILKGGKSLPRPDPMEIRTKKLVFRTWFVSNEDSKIAQTMVNYFAAVERKWPVAWKEKTPGLILNRTTGYNALMRLLPLILFKLGLESVHSIDEFSEIVDRVTLGDFDFTPENFKPGSSGESQMYRKFLANTGIGENEPWKGMSGSSTAR